MTFLRSRIPTFIFALLFAVALLAAPQPASADVWIHEPGDRIYTAEDTLTALQDATPTTRCVIRKEVGGGKRLGNLYWPPFDPNMPGDLLEEGPLQLLPNGLLPHFKRWMQPILDTFWPGERANSRNPFQNVMYGNWALGPGGLRSNWPTAKGCP